jgi:Spy/CpxP family protein refolding chaperone
MKHLIVLVALVASFSSEAESVSVSAPYAGQESREIKALSPEDVQAYLAGKGMGFAKAAELNGHPGPSHVLALSSQLGLTPEQTVLTKALFASMDAKAINAGAPLVDEERKLDRLFASKTITPELLSAVLAHIGELQAKVRAAHLEAHLAQVRILTPEQVALYMQLRGYTSTERTPRHEHRQHTGG